MPVVVGGGDTVSGVRFQHRFVGLQSELNSRQAIELPNFVRFSLPALLGSRRFPAGTVDASGCY